MTHHGLSGPTTYVLGHAADEQLRLDVQGARLRPFTERLRESNDNDWMPLDSSMLESKRIVVLFDGTAQTVRSQVPPRPIVSWLNLMGAGRGSQADIASLRFDGRRIVRIDGLRSIAHASGSGRRRQNASGQVPPARGRGDKLTHRGDSSGPGSLEH